MDGERSPAEPAAPSAACLSFEVVAVLVVVVVVVLEYVGVRMGARAGWAGGWGIGRIGRLGATSAAGFMVTASVEGLAMSGTDMVG